MDRFEPPRDLMRGVERRYKSNETRRRLIVIPLSLAVAAAGIGFFVHAFLGGSNRPARTAFANPPLIENGPIAFVAGTGVDRPGRVSLYVGDPSFSSVKQLSITAGWFHGIAWSPDATRLAFGMSRINPMMARSGFGQNLFVANSDGSGLKQLTRGFTDILGVSWSPDGSKIVFGARGSNGYQIYEVNSDGSGLHEIGLPGTSNIFPSWSPDGSRIAFISGGLGAPSKIYSIDPDGTGLHLLASLSGSADETTWSPDGSRIAFIQTPATGTGLPSNRGASIEALPAAGGSPSVPVSCNPPQCSPRVGGLAWSPDSKTLLLSASQGSIGPAILEVDLKTEARSWLRYNHLPTCCAAWGSAPSSTTYPKGTLPAPTRARLLQEAMQIAKQNGDPNPSSIEAVATNSISAQSLLYGRTLHGFPVPLYVVQETGNFVCNSCSGGSSKHGSAASPTSGSALMFWATMKYAVTSIQVLPAPKDISGLGSLTQLWPMQQASFKLGPPGNGPSGFMETDMYYSKDAEGDTVTVFAGAPGPDFALGSNTDP